MDNDFDIAIVGMAGRFPGARNLEEFWSNLDNGVESIARLSEPELIAAGVSPAVFHRPDYVRAAPVLEDPALFDAAFFGFSPGEAASLDPQHRLLLELAQVALDDAGCDPSRFAGRVGVFAGSAINTYFFNRGLDDQFAENYLPTLVSSDKDFLATRVSYKLGLRGPSVTVQTACSTSLVAVHLARQSLLSEETDLALAGAVSVRVPHRAGYYYDGSGVVSPDGHVRAFDEGANGTVFGSGAGVVVLKRLADALAQGDQIYAVLKGSAVNNDGAGKAGYTAPSVGGQAEAMVEALANAGMSAADLSYVEAHGSGTPVGDRIELLALTQAFRQFTPRSGFCALGSVKTNVGHLDAAAGMASLMKTVLALRHGRLPRTLNFTRPNAEINLAETPFVVAAQPSAWPAGSAPRRAAVTATGMGGTNAAVVVEEAPRAAAAAEAAGPELLVWSAHTPAAATAVGAALASVDAPLAAIARTLQTGRRAWAERRCLVARDREDARREWSNPKSARIISGVARNDAKSPVVFLLPGMGDHYAGMGRGLYEAMPLYRAEIDRCAAFLQPRLGRDLREILLAAPAPTAPAGGIDLKRMLGRGAAAPLTPAEQLLEETRYSQPALFVTEYALARLWMQAGVRPDYLVGHSMGEYVAACLAGVFSLEDALRLITLRAQLVQKLPPGAMLAVMLSEAELRPLLEPGLSLSLINGPKLCVVAGPVEAMANLEARLKAQSAIFRPVRNGHAFHSRLLDPIVEPFVAAAREITFSPPQLPFISNVTGTWITPEQAVDPRYWGEHARQTARFSDALGQAAKIPGLTLVEVGPGRTLGVLASQHPAWPAAAKPLVVSSLRHHYENFSDAEIWWGNAGRLWVHGTTLDWEQLSAGRPVPAKVGLPAYPFERQRHWLERAGTPMTTAVDSAPPHGVKLYVPGWRRAGAAGQGCASGAPGPWLVIGGRPGLTAPWTEALERQGAAVTSTERENSREDAVALLKELGKRSTPGLNILFIDTAEEASFYRLLAWAQALAEQPPAGSVKFVVLTTGAQGVLGTERLGPAGALASALAQVTGRELPHVKVGVIDRAPEEDVATAVIAEFARPLDGQVVALRGKFRWVREFEPAPEADAAIQPGLRPRGVYLITGGTGGLGATLAVDLARRCQARLVLISRQGGAPELLAAVEEAGGEAVVERCDVADAAAVARVVASARERFGALHGVIHAAGIVQDGVLQLKTAAAAAEVLRPKIAGLQALAAAVRGMPLDWLVLFSSISAVAPRHGQGDYAAANAFLDAWAVAEDRPGSLRVKSINWPGWREVGILARLSAKAGWEGRRQTELAQAITTRDGLDAFYRVLALDSSQVVVSPVPPAQWAMPAPLSVAPGAVTGPVREVEPPSDDLEKAIAEIWSAALGLSPVGRGENFLELGGHSLLAMRVVAQIRAAYQIDFTLRKFFENPTVAQMAAAIQTEIMGEIEALSDDEASLQAS